MSLPARESRIRTFHTALTQAWGPQHWWPARTRFEVIIGAYLTQNTSWNNVELAMRRLRRAGVLNPRGIRSLPLPELEKLIRPAGYFRQKAQRLKTFIASLDAMHGGSLERMFRQPTAGLREWLLALKGVGPETADSILLYAGNHPVFVVDAYTRRIAERHGILPADAGYEVIRKLFERALAKTDAATDSTRIEARDARRETTSSEASESKSGLSGTAHPPSPVSKMKRESLAQVYNEMHALLVGVGKRHCLKSEARCEGCPLQPFLSG